MLVTWIEAVLGLCKGAVSEGCARGIFVEELCRNGVDVCCLFSVGVGSSVSPHASLTRM